MNDIRKHVLTLRQLGATDLAIARAAGVDRHTVGAARSGRPVLRSTAQLILAVTPAAAGRTEAGGTRLRLRALAAMGHSTTRMAAALGVSASYLQRIQRGGISTVEPELARAVGWLFEAWWDRRPPERSQYERSSAAYARARAMRGDWCAAGGLDDDLIDVPGYAPTCGYRPARGSGTAPEVRWEQAS